MKYLNLLPLLLLGACATAKVPEPIVTTVVVKEPVSVPCIPSNYNFARPDYVDSNDALLSAVDAAVRFQLLWAGRAQRIAREAENDVVITGCK